MYRIMSVGPRSRKPIVLVWRGSTTTEPWMSWLYCSDLPPGAVPVLAVDIDEAMARLATWCVNPVLPDGLTAGDYLEDVTIEEVA